MTNKSQIWLIKAKFNKIKKNYNYISTNKILERLKLYNGWQNHLIRTP